MSDKEIIIKWLKKVERRLRADRLFKEFTFGLSLFLLFPIAFKIIDLISPFRGRTVVVVLGVWILCVASYFIWRTRQKGTLAHAAAEIDGKAALSDELKTAYWFINNPRPSAWVENQIRRAARRVSELNIDRIYPWSVPRASYLTLGLMALLIALNFAPLPWNNNWLLLQAEPAFSLTESEQELLRQAEEALEDTGLARKVQEIMRQLQEGTIDAAEAVEQLKALQEEMDGSVLDLEGLDQALNEIAEALAESEHLAEIAQALRDRDLADAAKLLKELAAQANAEEMQDMRESLGKASEKAMQSLKEFAEDLKNAADNIASQDQQATRQALAKAAQFLEELAQQIESQERSQQAAQQLQQVQKSLQERSQDQEQNQEEPQGESTEGEEPPPGGAMPNAQASAGEQAGEPQEAAGNEGNQDSGQDPSGTPGETKNRPSAPLDLEVQLQQEALAGLYDEAMNPEKIEETSKQERSRLDYRNVESELSPAQKDLLNQERIPWEYRNLIKEYFEAIRPPGKQ